MKTSWGSLAIVAWGLCCLVPTSHAQNPAPPRTGAPPAAGAPAVARGTNVAVVDVGFIFRNAERFKRSMDEITKRAEDFGKQIEARRQASNKQVEQLRALARDSREYQALEEQIAKEQTQIRLDIARSQKDRVEEEARVYYNAYKDVEVTIKRFADAYGIDLVLRYNSEEMDPNNPESVLNGINSFVIFQRGLNITNNILAEVNRTPAGAGGGQAVPSATRPATTPAFNR